MSITTGGDQFASLSGRLKTHADILQRLLDDGRHMTRQMIRSLVADLREDTSTAVRLENGPDVILPALPSPALSPIPFGAARKALREDRTP